MKIVKILTFLTLALFYNITIMADIDYSQKIEFSGAFDKLKVTNEGIMLGENATNYPIPYYNGIYLSKDLNLNFSKKGMEGFKITDIDSSNGEVFVTTYSSTGSSQPGLYKVTNNFQKFEKIGRTGFLNKVKTFKDKVYYGGNNYGAWVINKDGTNNKQILGADNYGPQVDQIKSNSKNVFILSRGSLYIVNPDDTLTLVLSPYRLGGIEVTDSEIIGFSSNKFIILDFSGKVLYEKQFFNPLTIVKKYLNYVFLLELSPIEQKIWISNDLGKTFFESKTKFAPAKYIKEIELSGKDNISIFLNFANERVLGLSSLISVFKFEIFISHK